MWDFGAGATPPNAFISIYDVTYLYSGPKNIKLIVIDNNNCTDTTTQEIDISNLPNVDFSFDSVCAGQPTTFTDNSTANENPIAIWEWIFSDNTSQNFNPITYTSSFEKTFSITNNYSGALEGVKLIVTDSIGCSKSYEQVNAIPIHPLPSSNFIFNIPCEGEDFIFDTEASVNQTVFNDYIYGYGNPVWTFDSNPNNSIPWFYQVLHTAETNHISGYNSLRCTSTHSETVEIKVMPKITFTPSFNPSDRCGEDVIYNFDATHDNVNTWSYVIDGNPPYNSTEDFIHEFGLPGIYNLTINIYNNNGCSNTNDENIHIFPKPLANFTTNVDEECEGSPIIFTDKSIIPNDPFYDNGSSYITEWQWGYGCGHNSNYIDFTPNNQHTYITINEQVTTYKPTLTVVTDNNCRSEYQLTGDITIHPSPTAILNVTPLPDPGLYLFDGSQSYVGNLSTDPAIPNDTIQISSNEYNFIFSTSEPNSLNEQEEKIDYQFSSFSAHQNGMLYDVMLDIIDKNSILGCRDDTIVKAIFVDYFKGLFVPNILAPNSSDQSESAIFLPKGKSIKKPKKDLDGNIVMHYYSLQIFDKFGNLLWVSNKLDEDGKPIEGWDGTNLKGIALPQGTYIWKIHAIFSDGSAWEGMEYNNSNTKVKQGAVYLIR